MSFDSQGEDPSAREAKADSAATDGSRRDVAVALAHDRGSEDLPKIIASGHGAVAQQILEIAFARGIKVREDADLAEVLAAVEVESEIPLAAFAAVAEILSHVYRAAAEGSGLPSPVDGE